MFNSANIKILLISIFFPVLILFVFYPGYMSYDTLHALRGARYGVTDSIWPPMVSYIWLVIDKINDNPASMLFFQVYFLFLSNILILHNYRVQINYIFYFCILLISLPYFIGTIAVIWKDVLMTSFILMSFYLSIIRSTKKKTYLIISLILLFIATCIRHNAIFATLPLIYLNSKKMFNLEDKKFFLSLKIINNILQNKKMFIFFLFLTFSVIAFKSLTDQYSFTHFKNITSPTKSFLKGKMIRDLAGASICSNTNLFYKFKPHISVKQIKTTYNPKHVNLSKKFHDLIDRGKINQKELFYEWVKVFFNNPFCFFYHQLKMFQYLYGINPGGQFLITHPLIDKNEFGYVLKKSTLRDYYNYYILNSTKLFFFKPIFLFSILILLYLIKRKNLNNVIINDNFKFLTISSLTYSASLIVFGNAADTRLLFYTNTVNLLLFFILLAYKKKSN